MKNPTNSRRFYSTGTGNLAGPAQLLALAQNLQAVVIDVRRTPWGHVRAGFSRDELVALLGDRYEWRGAGLGGARAGSLGPSRAALDTLVLEHEQGARLLLLCAEVAPVDCHRHFAIAIPLASHLVVNHVHFDRKTGAEEVIEATELARSITDETPYRYTDLADHYPSGPVAALPTVTKPDAGRRIR